MFDHLSLQCRDVRAAADFYQAVLAPLGYRRVLDIGWSSPTSLAVLHRLGGDLKQLDTLPVDGAPAGLTAPGSNPDSWRAIAASRPASTP